jgi:hypothetical protein
LSREPQRRYQRVCVPLRLLVRPKPPFRSRPVPGAGVRARTSTGHQEAEVTPMSVLCRFLDAGVTSGASCSGGRRPKSARARSRGEVWAAGGSQHYGDLIFTPVMVVGAELAPGDLDRVWSGAWKRATGIAVAAWSVSTGGRLVDRRDCAERDRRQRGASATERESGGAHGRSGS